ncbi:LRR receptor-like serine/threonine-protein kinase ER2 isoform X1 [Cornus florida]|uniref:LRR receptor-like serine/threonine-protein kinase ER2 isoform X1 n=1 Tax=Cornus florida TaxID=4283 RepID=UPI00289E1781|nr:LRR receptor-like serine/threonine-protein kinase ER2 isoform X1 [Cornus florida]
MKLRRLSVVSMKDLCHDVFGISKEKKDPRDVKGNQGKIPSVIGLMQTLAMLDLSCNMLSGAIPPILGNLTYTEKLNVHGNELNGTIPPIFERLESMTYLFRLEMKSRQQQILGRTCLMVMMTPIGSFYYFYDLIVSFFYSSIWDLFDA